MRITYTATTQSITVHLEGEVFTIKHGDPNFDAAKDAVYREDMEAVKKLISKGLSMFLWLKDFPGWSYKDNTILYKGDPLPSSLHARMIDCEQRGQSPQNLAKFWTLLQENPSWRSVQQTYSFLQHSDISIDDEGFIHAYKGVQTNFFDCHTGKTHQNTVGATIKEPRNKISDDPQVACHFGLHAGDITYARSFSQGRVVIVRINPRDVVCIPNDNSQRKLRCCEYTVVGVHNESQKPLDMLTDIESDEALESQIRKTPSNSSEDQPWLTFNDLSDEELSHQNMEHLRKYASRVLHIVGAGKLRKYEQNAEGLEVGLVYVIRAERAKNRG